MTVFQFEKIRHEFWIALLNKGQFDYGKSENHGPMTLGYIPKALGPKNHKKSKNFKVIIS